MLAMATTHKTRKPMATVVVLAIALVCALAAVLGSPSSAFAANAGYEGKQDFGVFVGKDTITEWGGGEKEYRDPATLGVTADVDLGIYVGSGSTEDITGTSDKIYKDPASVNMQFETDLGIYIGGTAEDADVRDVVDGDSNDSSANAGEVGITTDLGIFVGKDVERDALTQDSTNFTGASVEINTDLGIYVGDSTTDDTITKDEQLDTSNIGTTVDTSVDLGIYIGDGSEDDTITQSPEIDPDNYGTTVEADVNLGIFVGGTVDVETGTGEVNPSTTLVIRVVNPEQNPEVEDGVARVTWALGDGADATWPDGTSNTKGDYIETSAEAPSTAPSPGTPSAPYQNFAGWKATENGVEIEVPAAGPSAINLAPKSEYVFTAQWTGKTYSVDLHGNGGTVYGESDHTATFTYPDTLSAPAYPNVFRESHILVGWYESLDSDGNGVGAPITSVTAQDVQSGTTSLTAVWEEIELIDPDIPEPQPGKYATISFVQDGDPLPDMYLEVGTDSLAAADLPTPSHPQGTPAGPMVFVGWFDDAKFTTAATDWDGNSNKTYYGKWQNENSVTVKFMQNHSADDTTVVATVTDVPLGGTLSDVPGFAMPEPAARAGYMFGGWFAQQDNSTLAGNQRITLDTTFSMDTNVYAQWIAMASIDVPINVYLSINQVDASTFTVSAAKESQTSFVSRSPLPVNVVDAQLTDKTGYEYDPDTGSATGKQLTYEQRVANAKEVLGSGYATAKLNMLAAEADVVSETLDANLLKKGTDTFIHDAQYELTSTNMADYKALGWTIFGMQLSAPNQPAQKDAGAYIQIPEATYESGALKQAGTRDVYYTISDFDSTKLKYMAERLPIAALTYTVQLEQ